MQRASLERDRTLREWQRRFEMDRALSPGFFRKGRRARGCHRACAHCRDRKGRPTRQDIRTAIAMEEWALLN